MDSHGHHAFEVLQSRSFGRSVGCFFVNFHWAVTSLIDDLGFYIFVCILPQVYTWYCEFDISSRYDSCRYRYFFLSLWISIILKIRILCFQYTISWLKQVITIIYEASYWSLAGWKTIPVNWNLASGVTRKSFLVPLEGTSR